MVLVIPRFIPHRLKRLRRVPEAQVIAEFLKNEFYQEEYHHDSERFERLVMGADINNEAENVIRRALLFRRRSHLWRELPPDTEWWEVEVTPEDVENFRVFPRAEWRKIANGSFQLRDIVGRVRSARSSRRMRHFINGIEVLRMGLQQHEARSSVLLIGIDERHPLTILEGNHRLTAACLVSAELAHNRFRYFCGFSPAMNECCWYQSSFGNVWRYVRNRIKSLISDGEGQMTHTLPHVPEEPRQEVSAVLPHDQAAP